MEEMEGPDWPLLVQGVDRGISSDGGFRPALATLRGQL